MKGHTQTLLYVALFSLLLALSTGVFLPAVVTKFTHTLLSFPVSTQSPSVAFVGDIMLGRNVEELMDEHGATYPFLRIGDFLKKHTVVGNFESAMADPHIHTPDFTFQFSTKKEYATQLVEQGVSYLALSNNHAYDYGTAGYQQSKASLRAAGAQVFGDASLAASSSVTYVDYAGESIALIGVYAVYSDPSTEEVTNTVSEASKHSSIQIAYVHWGTEYELVHNARQEDLAKLLIDKGVDAVVGHHPHVVQDIGVYKGSPIFYSLGNFIFDQYFSLPVQEGLVLSFDKKADTQVWKLVPVTSIDAHSQPRLATEEEKSVFLQTLAKRSEEELRGMILAGMLTFKQRKE